jgi:hypothetical protein
MEMVHGEVHDYTGLLGSCFIGLFALVVAAARARSAGLGDDDLTLLACAAIRAIFAWVLLSAVAANQSVLSLKRGSHILWANLSETHAVIANAATMDSFVISRNQLFAPAIVPAISHILYALTADWRCSSA